MKRVTTILSTFITFFVFGAIDAAAQTAKTPTTPIDVGETAPEFTLTDHNGKTIKLSDARGKSPVVLVFYRGYW